MTRLQSLCQIPCRVDGHLQTSCVLEAVEKDPKIKAVAVVSVVSDMLSPISSTVS